MEIKYSNTAHYLKLTALTPVHIGGSSEKHLKAGIDFFQRDNHTYIILWDELFKNIQDEEGLLSSHLANADYDKLKEYIIQLEKTHKKVFTRKTNITTHSNDIKINIRDGFGRPYIPGSSLKGVLSSIIINGLIDPRIKGKNKSRYDVEKIEEETLGRFHESIMRFISVEDIYIDETGFYNTKVFSLSDDRKGAWKNARKGNKSNSFNPNGFTSIYESFPINSSGVLTLKIYDGLSDLYKQHTKKNPLKDKLKINSSDDILSVIFNHINQYTKQYIEKEIKYLNTYRVGETDNIVSEITNIQNQIEKFPSFCVLRMASGSGYYSITGDWRFEDHLWNIPNAIDGPNKLYKTRRFVFERENNKWKFYPMGFIRLEKITEKEYEKLHKEKNAAKNEEEHKNIKNELYTASTTPVIKHTASSPAPIAEPLQPPKPTYFTGKLKAGDLVDAELVKIDPFNTKFKTFRLFLFEPGKEQEVKLSYFVDLPIGFLAKVQITNVQKDKVISISFVKQLK